ncbi:MAG TPA: DUF1801 domain-containing protein [Chitinophagaceae bacterium]
MQKKPKDIDDYISGFEGNVKAKLEEIRAIIRKAAPTATETISYSMPAFKMNKVLVYFAGYNHHIGFYPTPSAIEKFAKELTGYTTSKGAVQFPIDQTLPKQLIQDMVSFRIMEDEKKS